MGYLLQLIGAPLLVVGLFSIVGGAAWFFLGGDDVSVLLALAWVGPGVISVAESREEVATLIQEAIEFHLEGMREEGIPIPAPSSFAGEVEITPAA